MTRRTKLLVVVAGLATVTAAVPWLVPLSGFIPEIEDVASERIGARVHVGDLRVALLPLPHLTIKDVEVGDEPIGRVERIRVWPDIWQLFSRVKVMREVRLEGVLATDALAMRLLAIPKGDGPERVRMRRIVLERGELRLPKARLQDLSARVELDEDGRIETVRVERGRKVRIDAQPAEGKTWTLEIAARAWTPPVGPAIQFDRIDATATLDARGIRSRDVRAKFYGGRVTGTLEVAWKPDWLIDGDLAIERVRLQPLATVIADNRSISGTLSGKPRFNLRARHAGDLLASLRLASDFAIENGVLRKVDLVAAARNPLGGKPAEGETRFDELTGHVEIDPTGYHFSRLRVASGLLRATGDVSVARDQTLEGRVDAELRGTASLVSVPLNVSGTVQDPSVAPTKTAVVGAVAGSVLLPGIGTAVGLKASQLTDRLFGKRRKSEAQPAEEAPNNNN